VKMALFIPMLIARVRMARAENPGAFNNWRMAKRRSFILVT
jgi:hypothetical protein